MGEEEDAVFSLKLDKWAENTNLQYLTELEEESETSPQLKAQVISYISRVQGLTIGHLLTLGFDCW